MVKLEISSFSQLHEAIESLGRGDVIYRGQTSSGRNWTLKPKIGRLRLNSNDTMEEEKTILSLFKERSPPYLKYNPSSDWEWLAIAQHYGLPTRLLDRTGNPLVAAYFAVEEKHSRDSVIFALKDSVAVSTRKNPDPFKLDEISRFIPKHISERITAQSGVFTVHSSPKRAFTGQGGSVSQIVINAKYRGKLKSQLSKYGIHRSSLFPDLDGLSRHILWLRSRGINYHDA